MPSVLRITIGLILVGAVLYAVELICPAITSKRWWRKDSGLDLGYFYLTALVTKTITKAAMLLTVLVLALLAGRKLDAPHLAAGLPLIAAQPAWLIVMEVLVLGDLIGYWMHRAFHSGNLWRFHAIHHSSIELDWLSSVRLHPVNELITKIVQVVPFVLLGFPLNVLAAYVPFLTIYALLIHANVNWSFGALRYVIATPLFHRWHHTAESEGVDKNFAGLFPIFDIVFGTFYMPIGCAPVRFGIEGSAVPQTFLAQIIYPFRPVRLKSVQLEPVQPENR